MVSLIQESGLPRSSSPPDSYGRVSMLMFAAGLVPVYGVNVPRFSDTPPLHSHPSQPLLLVLMSSTLTWLDHCHHHEDSLTCSPVLTVSQGGRKPFPSLASQPKLWLKPSSVAGSLALAFLPLLSRTVADNSSPSYGTPS